ncbi:hypothetical protein Prudu_020242 [Prunus dulcis]|uniref:hydroxymethylglutaryl-CoA reductase (NADPH) n=1 Tax=Prunus dulcis TaxID=3755 RepID=A0A4Y1RUT0_PRUDU|nr:hypothetical protein Prudu_020242 [Prunus dulcis]
MFDKATCEEQENFNFLCLPHFSLTAPKFMDLCRRPPPNPKPLNHRRRPNQTAEVADPNSYPKASDALPLPLYLTNGLFVTLFFTVAYFLLTRWREKIRTPSSLPNPQDDNWNNVVGLEPTPLPPPGPKKDETLLSKEDEQIVQSVLSGTTASYGLEAKLGDCMRAAAIRREALERTTGRSLEGLPLDGLDYESILGQCCENPVGYVQIPVGVAGPLLLDGKEYMVPLATTEGTLVASINRGLKAIYASGGAISVLHKDAMTRAPIVRFGSAVRAAELMLFVEDPLNFDTLAAVFNRQESIHPVCLQHWRCHGMNMISKGVQYVLEYLQNDFPDMEVIGISVRNFCSDKKAAAVNWIQGRGKSVVCEAIIKEEVVRKVLKTNMDSLAGLNVNKNLIGSAMAGTVGGFNAHASNIVSALFIATGQDPAQNVESSHCITQIESVKNGKAIYIAVSMPALRNGSSQVGTIGGGTQLASQSACLNLLGVKGANRESPGANARQLARIVAGAVLAGEVSLLAAIDTDQLMTSHMKYNRSSKDVMHLASTE